MGAVTGISWCHHTFNGWWGCSKVSPGCARCYAEAWAKRTGHDVWGELAPRREFGQAHWDEPLKWARAAKAAGERRRVFCGSMCDWAEEHEVAARLRPRLFELIERTPDLDWLLLTKRPENIPLVLPMDWQEAPRPNVWLGTTIEDQKRAVERLAHMRKVRAHRTFLSLEPLLEQVDLVKAIGDPSDDAYDQVDAADAVNDNCEPEEFVEESELECDAINYGNDLVSNPEHVEWMRSRRWRAQAVTLGQTISQLIVGGESAPKGARPFDMAWARKLRDQAHWVGCKFFMKQMGSTPLDQGAPIHLQAQKGDDMTEWPVELRVQEVPTPIGGTL